MVSKINPIQVKGVARSNSSALPSSANLACPYCKIFCSISIGWKININNTGNVGNATCPSCSNQLRFFYIVDEAQPMEITAGELYLYPGARERQAISGIDTTTTLSEPIKRTYESAIVAFNTDQWNSTAVMSRRLLEGIVQILYKGKAKKSFNLNEALIKLPEVMDFNKPIVTIADAIRKIGNLGAHFSDENEPDEETSILLMDLLDYFIEYLFVLPARIEALHDKIEEINRPKKTSDHTQEQSEA